MWLLQWCTSSAYARVASQNARPLRKPPIQIRSPSVRQLYSQTKQLLPSSYPMIFNQQPFPPKLSRAIDLWMASMHPTPPQGLNNYNIDAVSSNRADLCRPFYGHEEIRRDTFLSSTAIHSSAQPCSKGSPTVVQHILNDGVLLCSRCQSSTTSLHHVGNG